MLCCTYRWNKGHKRHILIDTWVTFWLSKFIEPICMIPKLVFFLLSRLFNSRNLAKDFEKTIASHVAIIKIPYIHTQTLVNTSSEIHGIEKQGY